MATPVSQLSITSNQHFPANRGNEANVKKIDILMARMKKKKFSLNF